MAYALGRRLESYDQPADPPDRAGRRGQRLPLVVDRARDREEPGVPAALSAPGHELAGRQEINDHGLHHSKALSRRTVLRGLGATLALPLLDAMVPAFVGARPGRRHGRRTASRPSMCPTAWRCSSGRRRAKARASRCRPSSSRSAPFRDQMIVLSGLKANWNYIHAGASGSFLTGTTRGGRNEVEIIADVSMDQILAQAVREGDAGRLARAVDGHAGQRRRLHRQPELRLHAHDLVEERRRSRCRWNTTRASVFEKLFGDSGSTERTAREARLRSTRASSTR